MQHLVVGKDFVFGYRGQGNINKLCAWGRDLGFKVTVVTPLKYQGQIVSSSVLRRLVAEGSIASANVRLGWKYALHGVVVQGEGRGRKIGLPTANLRSNYEIVPWPGTYAVGVKYKQASLPGLCHIGKRPTFHPWGPETVEIHIPGWHRSLYGRRLEVFFLERLRAESRFPDAQALVAQVKKDWQQARRIWTKHNKSNTI